MQVLLVTSGWTWTGSEFLTSYRRVSSTELLLPSATSWRDIYAAPLSRTGLRGATLNNRVIMTGGMTGTNLDRNFI